MTTPAITKRQFKVRFAKPCPACKGEHGTGEYEYRLGHVFKDTWTCACGRVYYAWEWESTMKAAQECRALGATGEGSSPSQAVPEPPPPAGPPPPREQLRLW